MRVKPVKDNTYLSILFQRLCGVHWINRYGTVNIDEHLCAGVVDNLLKLVRKLHLEFVAEGLGFGLICSRDGHW
jgi:hypothetical protein